MIGRPHKRCPASTKGTTTRRSGFARALASAPDLAVLDEPTGHLDADNVAPVLAVLRARNPSTAVFIATHDERLMAVAYHVITLDAGRVAGIH